MNKTYGYVNGKAVYSRDEFIFEKRGFGAIENDTDLLALLKRLHTDGKTLDGNGGLQNFISVIMR